MIPKNVSKIYEIDKLRYRTKNKQTSAADPDPGSGMGKKTGSGSGMKNPDHITESLKTINIFWLK
jgi:hypothetical protein